MLYDLLLLFIVVTILCFIISIFLIEDKPVLAIPFIFLGMLFSILCTYGLWDVEFFYVGYNANVGNTSSYMYSTMDYGDPYSYIFFFVFWIFFILFFKAGFNMWRDALKTQAEMNYRTRDKRWR